MGIVDPQAIWHSCFDVDSIHTSGMSEACECMILQHFVQGKLLPWFCMMTLVLFASDVEELCSIASSAKQHNIGIGSHMTTVRSVKHLVNGPCCFELAFAPVFETSLMRNSSNNTCTHTYIVCISDNV